jgi:hypothetical protein
VLVELGVVEQRYRAVLEVLDDGAPVTGAAAQHPGPPLLRQGPAVAARSNAA